MKPTFCLRAASQEDFDRLFHLRIAAMRESLERIGRFDERRALERFKSSFQPEHTRLILIDDTLAGCVAMKPAENGLLLEHFYLYPAFQGRGLGAAILAQLLDEADVARQTVRLSVLQKSDAGRFYKRFGFIETGQDEWDVYLERPSHAPAAPSGQKHSAS
ncbi:GNAT family N-acetyltransferase [Microvirga sp. ACRRW]|uniref:GNAT family N-acetyltransferase n=1 Tax=Microvirga sp. ACRRW TaxID=2918205 RepID=UPI001EF63A01|nr:GNAT family N-acetyltransferase [Microvirga sp. ACRRW]MCG7393784.1 GNAT family N-acetyltransferase [Microvirga sp. ACRRW]